MTPFTLRNQKAHATYTLQRAIDTEGLLKATGKSCRVKEVLTSRKWCKIEMIHDLSNSGNFNDLDDVQGQSPIASLLKRDLSAYMQLCSAAVDKISNDITYLRAPSMIAEVLLITISKKCIVHIIFMEKDKERGEQKKKQIINRRRRHPICCFKPYSYSFERGV